MRGNLAGVFFLGYPFFFLGAMCKEKKGPLYAGRLHGEGNTTSYKHSAMHTTLPVLPTTFVFLKWQSVLSCMWLGPFIFLWPGCCLLPGGSNCSLAGAMAKNKNRRLTKNGDHGPRSHGPGACGSCAPPLAPPTPALNSA